MQKRGMKMDKYKKYPVPTKAHGEDQIKYMIASLEREIASLKDKLQKAEEYNELFIASGRTCQYCSKAKDKLHRRNMQIKDLKAKLKGSQHYNVKFNGREVGALGITYPIAIDVFANTQEEVKNILYDWFEHISSLKIVHHNAS